MCPQTLRTTMNCSWGLPHLPCSELHVSNLSHHVDNRFHTFWPAVCSSMAYIVHLFQSLNQPAYAIRMGYHETQNIRRQAILVFSDQKFLEGGSFFF
jgi:hypothetical protein